MLPRIITEPLGGSALSRAAAAGEPLAPWYEPRPRGTREWRTRAEQTREPPVGSEWLAALLPAVSPSGRAAERLHATAAARGVVVTTGQQPGLFGGPIYTWSKALSALALADALEASTGVPVAPVFWAATDDSDFAEASWTMVARAGGVDELRMNGAGTGASMANVSLGDVSDLLDKLARGAGSAAFPEPLALARRAYRSGNTIGGAYVELLRAMLEPLGISVLDAAHPSVRQAAAPLLRKALHQADALTEAIAERNRALLASGHAPQVADVENLSLVFATRDGARQRVRNADARTVAAKFADDSLSPNVLLRPVVERWILPTVAYVAGPAELAYFAQTSAVAATLGAPSPLAVPRWSCTIVEPHVDQIMERLALAPDDLTDPHRAETRLARAALPAEVSSAIARMRNALDEGLAVLERHGSTLVPLAVIEGGANTIAHRLTRMERRFVAAVKRRHADTLTEVATARGSLYPAGKRQERALNFLPLLARHGQALLAAMLAAARGHAGALIGPAHNADAATAPTAVSAAPADAD